MKNNKGNNETMKNNKGNNETMKNNKTTKFDTVTENDWNIFTHKFSSQLNEGKITDYIKGAASTVPSLIGGGLGLLSKLIDHKAMAVIQSETGNKEDLNHALDMLSKFTPDSLKSAAEQHGVNLSDKQIEAVMIRIHNSIDRVSDLLDTSDRHLHNGLAAIPGYSNNADYGVLKAIIPGIGFILSGFLGVIVGKVVQKRINSMYYACKEIKDPIAKTQCRLKLLDAVMNIQHSKINDPHLTDKQREKLQKSLGTYKEARDKLIAIGKKQAAKVKQEGTEVEYVISDILTEAAQGGSWKGALSAITGAGIVTSIISHSRIEKQFHHCKELPDKDDKLQCQKKILKEIVSVLKSQYSKEPYNIKLGRKIKQVEQRLASM